MLGGAGEILWLGGRLQNAVLGYCERHPIILPKHWQLVQAMQEQIWRSLAKDYLHSLQVRNK